MEKRALYALVAVIIIVVAVVAAVVLLQVVGPRKYQVELWYNNDGHYGDTEDELATVLKDSIEACGKIAVTLRSDPWAVYKENWANGRMDVFLLGWYPDYFDTDDYISPFLSVSGGKSTGSFYNNSQVDQWVTDEQSTTDPGTRSARFTSIQNKLAEDVPYLPLLSGNAHVAYVAGVQNVELHPVSFKWFIMDKPGAAEITGSTTDKVITLDPADAYDYFSIEIINQVFDTLLVYEPVQAKIMPGLATSMPTVSSDGLDWTFTLRPSLKFHDGSALNATVVKRSIERVVTLDLAGSAAFLLYDVGALDADPKVDADGDGKKTNDVTITVAPNDRDITFHLHRPVSFFGDLMAFSASAPVPWDYSQTGKQPSTVGNVRGSGPYRMTQHVENQLIVLERYANYHTPNLYNSFGIPTIPVEDKVTINIRGTATALKNDIETKAVDVVYRTLDPQDLADLQSRASQLGITVDLGASPQIRYVVFNVNRVTDVRVRQAFAYSVDRAKIDQTVFQGLVEPLYTMIPATMLYSQPVFQAKYGSSPNCQSANDLLTQLGYAVWLPGVWVARDS